MYINPAEIKIAYVLLDVPKFKISVDKKLKFIIIIIIIIAIY